MSSSHTTSTRWIAAEEVEAFVGDELYDRERRVPVVGVTTTARGEFLVDPDRLAAELGDQALVVAFANGEATWALADALPARLEVYGGGARIWWPGLQQGSSPYDHRLFVVRPGEGDAVARQIVDAVRRYTVGHPEAHERAPAAPVDLGVTEGGKPILLATVTEVSGERVFVEAGSHRGVIGHADESLANLSTRLTVGDQLRVFVGSEPTGTVFSIQGLGALVAPSVPGEFTSTSAAPDLGVTKGGKPILLATVTEVRGRRVYVEAGSHRGVIGYADESLANLATRFAVGDQLRVFVASEPSGTVFSIQGLSALAAPSVPGEVAHAPAGPVDLGVTKGGKPILLATVTEVRGGRVHVAAGSHRGIVGYADERVANLATRFAVGDQLRVFIASESEAGAIFSMQGLGAAAAGAVQPPTILRAPARAPAPPPVDPWQIVAEEYRTGDVVRGLVCLVRERFVLIELLPGAACFCHLSELADAFVRHPDEVVKVGDRVNVELLSLEPEARRGEVSIRRAGFAEPRPAIAPGPGQPAFLDDGPDAPEDRGWGPGEEVPAELRAELDAADADRTALRARLAEVKEQLVALRKELRSANDRLANCEARLRGDDPLASEVAFITAVRVEYARTMGEGDRFEFPLLPMRLHRDFLASARALEGVDVEKIVEVCAQVACQRAHKLAGREVHVLREGDVGPGIVRDEDGARAWRCAIQINTPSARRLHWWEIPGERSAMGDSRVIEFASVGVHDDVAIPI
jgi:hypothetical protein